MKELKLKNFTSIEEKCEQVLDELDEQRKEERNAFRNLVYALSKNFSDGELLDLFLDKSDNYTFLEVIKILVQD